MAGSIHYVVILACATGITAGQILFKYAAVAMRMAGTPWRGSVLAALALALAVYGTATLAWIWVLQYVPLSRAYPFMALSFALVPAASWLAFGERVDLQYVFGTIFIVIGLALTAR